MVGFGRGPPPLTTKKTYDADKLFCPKSELLPTIYTFYGKRRAAGAPPGKMKEMGARRRRAPFFGAAGAEKGGKWGRAAGAPPNFSAPQAPKNWVCEVFLIVLFGPILACSWPMLIVDVDCKSFFLLVANVDC